LFVSTLYNFQYVPAISWEGNETERKHSFREHYFDNIDFNDSLLIRSRDLKSWMDQYVNLYGEEVTTNELRDSLFTVAGRTAIEKAKTGHPKVYGWMVDYFYKGYESFGIQPGIAMLAPYLDDPNCLTSKRQAILKRLEGMKTIVPGTLAPDFTFTDESGKSASFQSYHPETPYKMVLFWSADCSHCMELVHKLYTWWQKPGNAQKLTVFALSLDETETEIAEYDKVLPILEGWKHVLTQGGVNSPEAGSYYILATPVMIVVNSLTNEIVSMPENIEQMESALK
jgi:peroxiredoxin